MVAIDQFPQGVWPSGLVATSVTYEGALFQFEETDSLRLRESYPAARFDAVNQELKTAPNFHYEPNDDEYNVELPRGPCVVHPDHWEFKFDKGIYIRHHCRPRQALFTPEEDMSSGPEIKMLSDERMTVVSGLAEPIQDVWRNGPEFNRQLLPQLWVGYTIFWAAGKEPNLKDLTLQQHDGVSVRFPDGTQHVVGLKSLRSLHGHKKIQQFDFSTKPELFEHAPSQRQKTFSIPTQQFGSQVTAERTLQRRRERPGDRELHGPSTSSMGKNGEQARQDVACHGTLEHAQQVGARDETPKPSTDELHRGHDASALRDAGNHPSFDDQSSGSDRQGADASIPFGHSTMSTRTGVGQETGKCSWAFHGVHGLRTGEEGSTARLRGAHHSSTSAGVPLSSRVPPKARRQDHQVRAAASGGGILWQFGKLLLTIILAGVGGLHQRCDEQEAGSQIQSQAEAYFQEIIRTSALGECGDLGIGVGSRPDGRGRGTVSYDDDGNPQQLKPGQRRKMTHNVRKALAMSRAARGAVQQKISSSTWPRRTFGYDLIEVFGGTSMISLRAGRNWNLRVLQPIDLRYGVDLRRRACRRWLMKMLDKWNPRLAIVEYPCTPWTILQRNCNYRDNPEALAERQEEDRPFLKLCKDIFRSQRKRGGHAICENPATADSQRQPEIMELRNEFYETTCCLCQFGMVSARGFPMLKRVRFIATHEHFVDILNVQCPGDHQHDPVAGRDTAASAAYTPDLADAICLAYIEVKEQEDFGCKHVWEPFEPRRSYFVDVDRAEDNWRPLFELVKEQLARKVQQSMFLDPSTELYRKIQALTPWQITNVQLAYLPKAKRVRPGMTNCHRASILMMNDDSITIETEYLPDAQAPRERFIQPVRWGIFVLGHAPGEPKEPSPAAQPPRQPFEEGPLAEDPMLPALQQEGLVRQDFSGECWFVGPPLSSNQKKLAPSLVRMHRNLGHPRKEDFVRALAQQDRLDPEVLVLARRLRCATCERTKRPLPPRPTSLKSTPAFNTKLSLDFVYLHDKDDTKFNYLHILDPAGGFNVFALVKSREPLDAFEAFVTSWANWAGFPDYMRLDRDGSFEGLFWEKLTDLGVELDYIPAEAHWQAGDVEAFNRVFRYTANKLIDEYEIRGEADMRALGASVAASLNDKVRMCGASANQWVFGKSPTVPGDLLDMDGKIAALHGLQRDEQLRLRNQVRGRADALISEYRINEALQRAVTRQGRPPRQRYEPGELIAYWRNIKKRKGKILQPGWFRGTVIGPQKGQEDGQQSNYWVSANGRCILVSMEQMRPAFGTELWPVGEEDLQWLEDNMPGEYTDERGEPPLPGDVPPEAQHEDFVVPYADDEHEAAEELHPEVPPDGPPEPHLPREDDARDVSVPPSDTTQLHADSPLATRAPGTPVAGLFKARPQTPPQDMPEPDPKRPRLEAEPLQAEVIPVPDDDGSDLEIMERPPHEVDVIPDQQVSDVLEAALATDKWELTDDGRWLARHHYEPRSQLFSPLEAVGIPVSPERLGNERYTQCYYVAATRPSYDQKLVNVTLKDSNETPCNWSDTWPSEEPQKRMPKRWTGATWFRVWLGKPDGSRAER